jgi:hypothetical protein
VMSPITNSTAITENLRDLARADLRRNGSTGEPAIDVSSFA